MANSAVLQKTTQISNTARVYWPSVTFFYLLACAISWPVFYVRNQHPDVWAAWLASGVVKSLLPATGPLIAGLASRWLFRRHYEIRVTFAGTSLLRSLAAIAAFAATLTAVGIGADEPHLTGLLYAAVFLAYAFFEETGWRGFLQDALRPLPEFHRYLLIGILWGSWHFTTFLAGTPKQVAIRLTLMSALWIGGSWGMGKVVEFTHALTVAALFHLTFNLFRSIPTEKAGIVLGVCIPVWVLLLLKWPRPAGPEAA